MKRPFNYDYTKASRVRASFKRAIFQKYFRLDIGTVEELISEDLYRQLMDNYFANYKDDL